MAVTDRKIQVLIADDDGAIRTVLNQAFTRAGYDVKTANNGAVLWEWIANGEGDLVITDVMMPGESAIDFLPRIQRSRPELPVIAMSAQNTFLTAIKVTEAGAFDYLPKPFDLSELLELAKRALAQKQAAQEEPSDKIDEGISLVGRSQAMQEVYRVLAKTIQSDLSVLITGESGTGKNITAKALHDYGARKSAPYVEVNLATIAPDMMEAELFGYQKDVFSWAEKDGQGKFDESEGGTLYLDEIADMSMAAQMRLLQVLQTGQYSKVGQLEPIKCNVRLIASTHRDLKQLIELGKFREDLYYRLNVVSLRLPPLRERREDIPDLVQHFIKLNHFDMAHPLVIVKAAQERLMRYSWPGNIRELENFIQRLAVMHTGEAVTLDVVENEFSNLNSDSSKNGRNLENDTQTIRDLKSSFENYLQHYFKNYDGALPPPGLYHRMLPEFEAPLLSIALEVCGGNQIKAANLLGLNRNTLRKKIRDLNLQIVKSYKN
jgi:two-component system nitrogen regulation response regulator GlnG